MKIEKTEDYRNSRILEFFSFTLKRFKKEIEIISNSNVKALISQDISFLLNLTTGKSQKKNPNPHFFPFFNFLDLFEDSKLENT